MTDEHNAGGKNKKLIRITAIDSAGQEIDEDLIAYNPLKDKKNTQFERMARDSALTYSMWCRKVPHEIIAHQQNITTQTVINRVAWYRDNVLRPLRMSQGPDIDLIDYLGELEEAMRLAILAGDLNAFLRAATSKARALGIDQPPKEFSTDENEEETFTLRIAHARPSISRKNDNRKLLPPDEPESLVQGELPTLPEID